MQLVPGQRIDGCVIPVAVQGWLGLLTLRFVIGLIDVTFVINGGLQLLKILVSDGLLYILWQRKLLGQ